VPQVDCVKSEAFAFLDCFCPKNSGFEAIFATFTFLDLIIETPLCRLRKLISGLSYVECGQLVRLDDLILPLLFSRFQIASSRFLILCSCTYILKCRRHL